MMEMICETLVSNSALTWPNTREDFSTFTDVLKCVQYSTIILKYVQYSTIQQFVEICISSLPTDYNGIPRHD
jgi:hypothetical protein